MSDFSGEVLFPLLGGGSEEFKAVSKHLKDNLNDDDIFELIHSTHVNCKTSSMEGFTFDEFYQIVSRFNANK